MEWGPRVREYAVGPSMWIELREEVFFLVLVGWELVALTLEYWEIIGEVQESVLPPP